MDRAIFRTDLKWRVLLLALVLFGEGCTRPNPLYTLSHAPEHDGSAPADRGSMDRGEADVSHGLRGTYYLGVNFDVAQLSRIDGQIDFSWGEGTPDPSMPVDGFSIRWTGQIRPRYSELYTFHGATDDGMRLYIDGQVVLDAWADQSRTEHASQEILLTARQKYDITMEYYENSRNAAATLFWSSAQQSKEVVPPDCLYAP